MGISSSSSGRRQRQQVNTNPSSVSSGRCASTCCACLGRSAVWDLEFYVHGIDFLPEYEKRRRRLAKLVRGGHLWSWNTSYMCFVSSAYAERPSNTATSFVAASDQLSCPGKQYFLCICIVLSLPGTAFSVRCVR